MMLGKLYKPKGLALETAQQVLEIEEPYAVNVAWGCSNGCLYCYGPQFIKKTREQWLNMHFPKIEPILLIIRQLGRMGKLPEGVFASFMTDPFLEKNRISTERIIAFLEVRNVKVATLSKVGFSMQFSPRLRHGVTIISLNDKFSKIYEPNVPLPRDRIKIFKEKHDAEEYIWVSMEPYPPSAIWKQDLEALLEELKFVDFILFGKWNYDARANTEQARQEYRENIQTLRGFCKSNNIRFHVKSDTLKFCEAKRK